MKKIHFTLGAIVLVIAVITLVFYISSDRNEAADAFISPSDHRLVSRGKVVYQNHCAACHGATLEGQPNWRDRMPNGRLPAPPHDVTGHTWHHPDAVLVDIIKNGLVPGKTAPEGYESDMPAYGKLLSEAEIVAVLAYIKSTWPPDILAQQKEVTLQSGKGN